MRKPIIQNISKAVVVHIREDYDVYIGRCAEYGDPKWGNKFIIGRDGTRAEVIAKYRKDLWYRILFNQITVEELAELHGKRLGCHCKPKACHGDVLVRAAAWAHNYIRTR